MPLRPITARLAHPSVRALAWLIGSPPLLDARDPRFANHTVPDPWCSAALDAALPWLQALDRAPQPLLDFLAARPTRRLGRLAESLLAFWFMHQSGAELLAQNLVVRGAQRTLGEFDFVFRAPGAARATHWETAIKFYLYRPELGGLAGYVGPGEQDVLAAKVERVYSRQLALSGTAEGAAALDALQVAAPAALAWIKGWLFYPFGQDALPAAGVNPAHARGWWLRAGPGWERVLSTQRRYAILPRMDWLAWPWLAPAAATLDRDALGVAVAHAMHDSSGALMVVELDAPEEGAAWQEYGRGFVVPDDWGRTAA